MTAKDLSPDEASEIGKICRTADDGNLSVGSFAAELIGESYPFSKAMCNIVFQTYDDETLGRRFAEWCDNADSR